MFRTIVISSILVSWLAACSSAPKPTDPVKLVDIQQTQFINSKWSATIGKTDTLTFAPTYAAGAVFAANEKGQIFEFDHSSGRTLLSFDTKAKLSSGIAVVDNLVFVGDQNAKLLAFDVTTKQKIWEQPLTSVLSEAPILVGSILVTRAKDGRLSGFNPQTGQVLWTFANTLPALNIRHTGTLTPVSEQLFLTSQAGGGLVVVNAQTGEAVWNVIVATARGTSDLERVTEVLSPPVVDSGQVCAVAFQGRIACFDAQSGQPIWASPASSSKGLAALGRLLVLTEDDGTVKAFDRTNGQVLWQNHDLKNRKVSAPVILSQNILVVDFEGVGHVIDPATGSIVGRAKLGTGFLTAQPKQLDESALLQGSSGKLVLVDVRGNS
ncbi:outer membrane protein assembly factor BamB [Neisseria sp. Ec49-e6-T10]|uniref:outer membrane protein assembly factor BamB n=1 Tax=Neisseria sp. Ec49-e6-T10 TaxID=3140744 RepID=UPI003EBC180B